MGNRRLRVGERSEAMAGGDEAKRLCEAKMEMGKIEVAEIERRDGVMLSRRRRMQSTTSS